MLAPENEFSDEYADGQLEPDRGQGPESSTIKDLLTGACAGWKVKPTSAEFYEAMQAASPTRRQETIASVLINEANPQQVLRAYWQRAFTWRQLVRAMQRRNVFRAELGQYVNLHRERK